MGLLSSAFISGWQPLAVFWRPSVLQVISSDCAAHVACRRVLSTNTTQSASQQSLLLLLGSLPLLERRGCPREGVSPVNSHSKAVAKFGERDAEVGRHHDLHPEGPQ
ncbi:hypothetical protein TcCL_NonESM00429 [Trypanosoma cruzi]|uniref:Uncharacterized protein n=1 Tax=Trypanosoma cruzi (strain CL Brener) TaxID=353153 RepID=Q4DQ40_TRYCC|nr:hypothetical protein Tc00.1047053511825.120 [Trypanosoma cruzi]EAN94641.1 hypothetical protein Tc00.1047053511825.120 [Trypanosoma cruzi]RNC49566.1 hypothetical protein TcCL_NonESM00429 [Trypanosoma cruzi]|eukprot:XP_816492.1 hypothetical protein [Trypanosoma cruzi strain CL Brener]